MEDKAFWYREYKQGRRFIVKIRPEESIIECVTALVTKEKIECAVVLSAIGSVQNVRLKDIKSGARNNAQTAAMKGVMHLVSDAEMKAIADYLSKVKP